MHCSENYDKDVLENKEKRIAGGGNFGGFIGLTTYGAGPFLVKGKIDRDNYNDEKDKKEDSSKRDEYYDPKLITNVGEWLLSSAIVILVLVKLEKYNFFVVWGYENVQKDQPYNSGAIRDGDKKYYDDEYLEYLGYRGPRGMYLNFLKRIFMYF